MDWLPKPILHFTNLKLQKVAYPENYEKEIEKINKKQHIQPPQKIAPPTQPKKVTNISPTNIKKLSPIKSNDGNIIKISNSKLFNLCKKRKNKLKLEPLNIKVPKVVEPTSLQLEDESEEMTDNPSTTLLPEDSKVVKTENNNTSKIEKDPENEDQDHSKCEKLESDDKNFSQKIVVKLEKEEKSSNPILDLTLPEKITNFSIQNPVKTETIQISNSNSDSTNLKLENSIPKINNTTKNLINFPPSNIKLTPLNSINSGTIKSSNPGNFTNILPVSNVKNNSSSSGNCNKIINLIPINLVGGNSKINLNNSTITLAGNIYGFRRVEFYKFFVKFYGKSQNSQNPTLSEQPNLSQPTNNQQQQQLHHHHRPHQHSNFHHSYQF